MKIVFFGTSEVGLPILKVLSEVHEIVQIVTSPDSKVGRKQEIQQTPIAEFGLTEKIPISKPAKVKNNPEFIEFLKTLNADIFVVVSYGKILPKELLEVSLLKTVNVHFSLLPKYRGPAPIQFALLNNEKITGTTIFILDELVDHGPVLAMEKLEIQPDDTFTTLAVKLSEVSAKLIIEVLPKYQSSTIIPQEQNHEDATKTNMIQKEDGQVNWEEETAQQIYNKFRAYSMWPGIWTEYKGQVLKILSCKPISLAEQPEKIHELTKDVIPCAENTYLKLIDVQLAGKNKMFMKDFLNGHPNFKLEDFEKSK